MAAAVLHDMVLNCDVQGLKATIKDLQKEGIDVKVGWSRAEPRIVVESPWIERWI